MAFRCENTDSRLALYRNYLSASSTTDSALLVRGQAVRTGYGRNSPFEMLPRQSGKLRRDSLRAAKLRGLAHEQSAINLGQD
jgi:hypothetical protein